MILDQKEEAYIRSYIHRQDEKLLRDYFEKNPKIITSAKKKNPNREEIFDIVTKIRCDTEVDVSIFRVMKVMKELMGITKTDEKKDDC